MLLKAILANVTALITQPTTQQQGALAPGFRSDVNLRASGVQQNRQHDPANVPLPNSVDLSELPIDEIEAMRSREITAKAVSGILLILLKWFKVSRKILLQSVISISDDYRHFEVRILYSTFIRLELSPISPEAVCSPGNRQSG